MRKPATMPLENWSSANWSRSPFSKSVGVSWFSESTCLIGLLIESAGHLVEEGRDLAELGRAAACWTGRCPRGGSLRRPTSELARSANSRRSSPALTASWAVSAWPDCFWALRTWASKMRLNSAAEMVRWPAVTTASLMRPWKASCTPQTAKLTIRIPSSTRATHDFTKALKKAIMAGEAPGGCEDVVGRRVGIVDPFAFRQGGAWRLRLGCGRFGALITRTMSSMRNPSPDRGQLEDERPRSLPGGGAGPGRRRWRARLRRRAWRCVRRPPWCATWPRRCTARRC